MRNSSVGYVLVMCNPESVENIIDEINTIDIVSETVQVDGAWKIVVKLVAKDLDQIRETIRWKLRKMIGIESTLTLIEYMA